MERSSEGTFKEERTEEKMNIDDWKEYVRNEKRGRRRRRMRSGMRRGMRRLEGKK